MPEPLVSSTNRGASPVAAADDDRPLRQTNSPADHHEHHDERADGQPPSTARISPGIERSSAGTTGSSDMHRLNHLATAGRNRVRPMASDAGQLIARGSGVS